jgi:hypothetical protein
MIKNKKLLITLCLVILILFFVSTVIIFQSFKDIKKQSAFIPSESVSKSLMCGEEKYNSSKQGCCSGIVYELSKSECCLNCSNIIFDSSKKSANLIVGITGREVSELQNFLIEKKFLTMPNGVETGYFGKLTKKALADFQTVNGISPANGNFDLKTREKIISLIKLDPGELEWCLSKNTKVVDIGECKNSGGMLLRDTKSSKRVVRKSSSGHSCTPNCNNKKCGEADSNCGTSCYGPCDASLDPCLANPYCSYQLGGGHSCFYQDICPDDDDDNGGNDGSLDGNTADGVCDFELECESSKNEVYVNESVDFNATLTSIEEYDCAEDPTYTWKNFSIGTENGVNLDLEVSFESEDESIVTKHVECPNVKVISGDSSVGDNTHECRILFVSGIGTSSNFSGKAKEQITDQGFVYTDGSVSGVGSDYDAVTVRGLMPQNEIILPTTFNAALNMKNSISSQINSWTEESLMPGAFLKKALVASFSIGSIATHNYLQWYVEPQIDLTAFLYDPPYNPDIPNITVLGIDFNHLPGPDCDEWLIGNGCSISKAKSTGIASSGNLRGVWTNGRATPPPEHSKFMDHPEVLNDIPAWIEENCPHLYFQ